jgi:hypothetical protein
MGKDIASTVVGMDLLQRGFADRYAEARAAHPAGSSIRVGRLRVKGTDPQIDAAIDAALAKTGFQVIQLDENVRQKMGRGEARRNLWSLRPVHGSAGKKYQFAPGVSLRSKVVILNGQINYATKYRGALARRAAWQAELAKYSSRWI